MPYIADTFHLDRKEHKFVLQGLEMKCSECGVKKEEAARNGLRTCFGKIGDDK